MLSKDFGFKLLTVPEVFSGHYFQVPDYQRSYSWGKKQVQDLLDDIRHLIKDPNAVRHFTGTLVLSRPDGKADDEYHVVDGQQRLTTLSILLHTLRDHLDEQDQQAFTQTYLLRGEVGNQRPVLTLNSQTHGFYEKAILEGKGVQDVPATMDAHDRLRDARDTCKRWIKALEAEGSSGKDLRQVIESKLGFLVYAPKEDAETGIMFEVINNRGKALSELEKVKNYLIYCCAKLGAKSLRADVDRSWSEILANLNKAKKVSAGEEGAFLRYALITKLGLSKSDSQNGYESLKKEIDIDTALTKSERKERSIKLISDLLEFIRVSSLWYARLYGRVHDGVPPQLIPVLDQIRAQARHASIMPLFLALVIRLNNDPARLERLLRLLEVVNFRVYMARGIIKRNDSHQAEIYGYAADYFAGKMCSFVKREYPDTNQRYLGSEEDALEYMMVWFGVEHATDQAFTHSFVLEKTDQDDFFEWRGLRYFLMNYEAYLQPNKTIPIDKILTSRSDGKSADYYSVEHLWATKNYAGGDNNRPDDKFQKRRLGNFALLELRLNIQGSDDDLDIKIPRYLNGAGTEPASDLQQVRLLNRDFTEAKKAVSHWQRRGKGYYTALYEELNNIRERNMSQFAARRWSLEQFLGYEELIVEYQVEAAEE